MNEKLKELEKESCPDFVELVDTFKEQLNYMEENSKIIFEKVNIIKDIREPESKEKEILQATGVLGELWGCIDRMRKLNDDLYLSRKGLTKFVG